MQQKALAFLQRNPLRYADMISSIAIGQGHVLWADEDGVLLFDTKARIHFLAVECENAIARFTDRIDHAELASVHQAVLVEPIARRTGLRPTMRCRQSVWTKAEAPKAPPSSLSFRPLRTDMAQTVYSLYSHEIGLEYIEERLACGELFGGFFEDDLAGFIGLHAEGSMGMLEVLPDYRRQGVARQLLAQLCRRQLERSRIPFSQFVEDNLPSRKLHENMGFSLSPQPVYWLEA